MITPLRLLFMRAPGDSAWRAGFDVAQAAAALDVPLELGFAGPGLQLIVPPAADTSVARGTGVWASLALLGVESVYAANAGSAGLDRQRSALPVVWLDPVDWRRWLCRASVQGW